MEKIFSPVDSFICSLIELSLSKIKSFHNLNSTLLIVCCFIIILFSYDSSLIYNKYVQFCKNGRNYFKNIRLRPFNNNNYYISICIPVYNMEKFIESALLSILNQSFQNFEIILVNDNSVDKTLEIISKYQINDDRIKVINHPKNLGVYCSRKDAIFNSKGEYIMLMDPDDMLLNKDLFKELYKL